MPIFDPNIDPAARIASGVLAGGNAILRDLIEKYTRSYNAVWRNQAATPAAIVAAFGTQAVSVFTQSAALAAFINGFEPGVVPASAPAEWSVTFNQDGSAAVKPAAPPAAS